MPIARRNILAAGALAPFLASCATNLSSYSEEALPALAARLGVCAASYVTLHVGKPGIPVALSGCTAARAPHADAIFQAASLTKPLIAFAALQGVRDGRLDLRAPVAHYLPDGYLHRHHPFDADDHRGDLVPASTLARIPLGTLSTTARACRTGPVARWPPRSSRARAGNTLAKAMCCCRPSSAR